MRVIHGKASQSKESRALQRALKSRSLRDANFKICQKGKSLACLSGLNGAIMHSKLLLVSSTFTRDNKPAKGVIWTGSANLGGPSGERTYNNGLTIYNDKKLWYQTRKLWDDMYAERNIGNDFLKYAKKHKTRYGYSTASHATATPVRTPTTACSTPTWPTSRSTPHRSGRPPTTARTPSSTCCAASSPMTSAVSVCRRTGSSTAASLWPTARRAGRRRLQDLGRLVRGRPQGQPHRALPAVHPRVPADPRRVQDGQPSHRGRLGRAPRQDDPDRGQADP
ncbi:hypothetical protein [Aeromicrobium sp. UC242_57]|uniref:hypothetical protein n=1 Tax=Aeromicrobium sp. UC242_57 TaxID=3374624 RepID=UPI0037B9A542